MTKGFIIFIFLFLLFFYGFTFYKLYKKRKKSKSEDRKAAISNESPGYSIDVNSLPRDYFGKDELYQKTQEMIHKESSANIIHPNRKVLKF